MSKAVIGWSALVIGLLLLAWVTHRTAEQTALLVIGFPLALAWTLLGVRLFRRGIRRVKRGVDRIGVR